MSKLKKWFKENITATDWIAIFILLLAVIGVFYLPHWVTQKSWKYDLGETESNEIGDTIGGILGPFIGFISACLVYLALREQVKANRLIGVQFLDEKKEKFEKVIYEEVLSEINSIISNFEKFDGNSIILESYERALSQEEILNKLYLAVIHEEIKKISNDSETSLFLQNFNKLVDVLELFNTNVKEEQAYLKIIELRIEKIYILLKKTPLVELRKNSGDIFEKNYSNLLILTKSTQIELIVRFLNVEREIYKKTKNHEKMKITSHLIQWYEMSLSDLKIKIDFANKYYEIWKEEFSLRTSKSKDYGWELSNPNKYANKELFYKNKMEELKIEYLGFLNEIKGRKIKYYPIENLIQGL